MAAVNYATDQKPGVPGTGTRCKKTYVVFVAEPHGRNGLFKTFDWNAISTGVEVVKCDRLRLKLFINICI